MKLLTVIILLAMVACTHKLKPNLSPNDIPPTIGHVWPSGTGDTIGYYSQSPLRLSVFNGFKRDSSWIDTVQGFIRYPKFGNKIPVLIGDSKNRQELQYVTDFSTPIDVYQRATAIYYVTHLANALTIGLDGQVTDTMRILKKIFVIDDHDKHGEGMWSDGTTFYYNGLKEFDLSKHYEFITPDKIVRE